jgi:hypothetical protein
MFRFDIRSVGCKWRLFVKDGKHSSPSSFTRRFKWKSANANDIQAAESVDELGKDDRADRRGFRKLVPPTFRLTQFPAS